MFRTGPNVFFLSILSIWIDFLSYFFRLFWFYCSFILLKLPTICLNLLAFDFTLLSRISSSIMWSDLCLNEFYLWSFKWQFTSQGSSLTSYIFILFFGFNWKIFCIKFLHSYETKGYLGKMYFPWHIAWMMWDVDVPLKGKIPKTM